MPDGGAGGVSQDLGRAEPEPGASAGAFVSSPPLRSPARLPDLFLRFL